MKSPAEYLTTPALFGRYSDVELLSQTSLREKANAQVAFVQHETALEVSRELVVRGLKLSWLAGLLTETTDQLRRKLHGQVYASATDLAAWRIALNLTGENTTVLVENVPADSFSIIDTFDNPDVIPLGVDFFQIPYAITYDQFKENVLFCGDVGSGKRSVFQNTIETLLDAGWSGIILDFTEPGGAADGKKWHVGKEVGNITVEPYLIDTAYRFTLSDMHTVLENTFEMSDTYWQQIFQTELFNIRDHYETEHPNAQVTIPELAVWLNLNYMKISSSSDGLVCLTNIVQRLNAVLRADTSNVFDAQLTFGDSTLSGVNNQIFSYINYSVKTDYDKLLIVSNFVQLINKCNTRAEEVKVEDLSREFIALVDPFNVPIKLLVELLTVAKSGNVGVSLYCSSLSEWGNNWHRVLAKIGVFILMRMSLTTDLKSAADIIPSDISIQQLHTLKTGEAIVHCSSSYPSCTRITIFLPESI